MSRKNISNELMTLGTDRKKQQNSAKKRSRLKESGIMTHWRREQALLLGNGKNNVIANKNYVLVIFSK